MQGTAEEQLHEALALYNRGDYFASQECLEKLFAISDPEEQSTVRALAMLSTAMHLHFHRGGGRGVTNLLRQCLILLEDLRPQSLGVQVDELYDALVAYLEELGTRKKTGATFFDRWLVPRIRYG